MKKNKSFLLAGLATLSLVFAMSCSNPSSSASDSTSSTPAVKPVPPAKPEKLETLDAVKAALVTGEKDGVWTVNATDDKGSKVAGKATIATENTLSFAKDKSQSSVVITLGEDNKKIKLTGAGEGDWEFVNDKSFAVTKLGNEITFTEVVAAAEPQKTAETADTVPPVSKGPEESAKPAQLVVIRFSNYDNTNAIPEAVTIEGIEQKNKVNDVVTLSCPSKNVTIKYTIDDSEPSAEAGTIYTAAGIKLTPELQGKQIKAVAIRGTKVSASVATSGKVSLNIYKVTVNGADVVTGLYDKDKLTQEQAGLVNEAKNAVKCKTPGKKLEWTPETEVSTSTAIADANYAITSSEVNKTFTIAFTTTGKENGDDPVVEGNVNVETTDTIDGSGLTGSSESPKFAGWKVTGCNISTDVVSKATTVKALIEEIDADCQLTEGALTLTAQWEAAASSTPE